MSVYATISIVIIRTATSLAATIFRSFEVRSRLRNAIRPNGIDVFNTRERDICMVCNQERFGSPSRPLISRYGRWAKDDKYLGSDNIGAMAANLKLDSPKKTGWHGWYVPNRRVLRA